MDFAGKALDEVWINPVDGIITSSCGERTDPISNKKEYHNGIDIAVESNTDVLAVRSGKVIDVGYDNLNGNYIKYETTDGYKIIYAHLNKVLAKKDYSIKQGQVIALSGNTGKSTGPHVHYTVWRGDMLINPMQFVDLPYTDGVIKEYSERGVALKRE